MLVVVIVLVPVAHQADEDRGEEHEDECLKEGDEDLEEGDQHRGPTAEGVMVDDRVVTQVVPRGASRSAALRRLSSGPRATKFGDETILQRSADAYAAARLAPKPAKPVWTLDADKPKYDAIFESHGPVDGLLDANAADLRC